MSHLQIINATGENGWQAKLLRLTIQTSLKPVFRMLGSVAAQRLLLNAPKLITFATEGVHIGKMRINDLELEVLSPPSGKDSALVLYLHGGGFCVGDASVSRPITTKLADETGYTVYSLEYSLAPEHPFPTAINQALEAYTELQKRHPDTAIILAGDSAGGNLCLALTRMLQQQCLPVPSALWLISPWVDLSLKLAKGSSVGRADPMLSLEALQRWARMYLPSGDVKNPLCSPREDTFEGFPPTLIQVGTDEILASDSAELHRSMLADGVASRLQMWNKLWHVFQLHANFLPAADEAITEAANFLTNTIEHRPTADVVSMQDMHKDRQQPAKGWDKFKGKILQIKEKRGNQA